MAAVLVYVAAVPADRAAAGGLALIAVAALGARAILTLGEVRSALGPFASAAEMAMQLALALAAAWLTGGLRSPLLAVAGAALVLARRHHGAPAARFLTLATVLGLIVLAAGSPSEAGAPLLATLARVSWPIAVLAAVELAAPPPAAGEPPPIVTALPAQAPVSADVPALRQVAASPAPPPAMAAPEPPAIAPSRIRPTASFAASDAPRERDLRAEILHDIRSPLSVIKVYADLIAERSRRGELPVDEHLHNLASEIELMELMVNGPAAARDRRNAAASDAVDLSRLLGELTSRYRETHGDRVRIEMSAERPRVEVRADPVALQRVFRNVLDNALQYTPAGGAVRIRLWADAVHAHVVVSDTGMGMSVEERERAFDPAYRGRGAQAVRAGGRGLGLTLSRELVEAMGGSISLWSEEDRGAEVRVLLPVAPEMAS